jgi:hypothetical protein
MTGLSPPAGTTILVSFITGISSWEVAGRFPRALVLVDTGGGVGACSIGPLYLDLGGTLGGGPRADCVFLILGCGSGNRSRSSSSSRTGGTGGFGLPICLLLIASAASFLFCRSLSNFLWSSSVNISFVEVGFLGSWVVSRTAPDVVPTLPSASRRTCFWMVLAKSE